MTPIPINMQSQHGRIPFIIGVSGHRFLGEQSDKDSLYEQVTRTLLYWHQTLNKHTPICLLTGLAEGADLVCVEAALAFQQEYGVNAIYILATLPMSKVAFEQDFIDSPEALAQFRNVYQALSTHNNNVIELKNGLDDSQYKQAINDTHFGDLRSSLYLNQSLFIAKYANVLMAIWDGNKASGFGGTADAVHYKLGRYIEWPEHTGNVALEPTSDFDGQVGGLVHHIAHLNVNRTNENTQAPLNTPRDLVPFSSFNEKFTAPAIGKLYSYGNFPPAKAHTLSQFIESEFIELLDELDIHNTTVKTSDIDKAYVTSANSANHISNIFNAVDQMAIDFQSRYRRLIALFFIIILPGFVAYELAANYNNKLEGAAILVGILLILLASFALIKRSQRLNYKWRYQLARGVAEGIRVRMSLNNADVTPSPKPLIPRKFRTHLPLINQAISLTEIEWWNTKYQVCPEKTNDIWLKPQINFLNARLANTYDSVGQLLYKRPLLAAQRSSNLATFFFYLAIAIGVLLCCSIFANQLYHFSSVNSANGLLMYGIQYSLLAGGLVSLWSELAGYKTTAMGYKGLRELYTRASVLIDDSDHQHNQKLLLDLAREAMVEHITWNLSEIDNDIKQK
jgi:hypothetical protein